MSAFEAHEHAEHAEHAAHEHDPFIALVSITIAALAVFTAVVHSVEAIQSEGAIVESNRAVLAQDLATDSWNFYQARSLKKRFDSFAADQGGPKADSYKKAAAKDAGEQDKIQEEAKKHEEERKQALEGSEGHEKKSHRLTFASSLLEIGIAIATVAIITRRRSFWIASVLLGLAGLIAAGSAWVI